MITDEEREQIRRALIAMNDNNLKKYLNPDDVEPSKRHYYQWEAVDELRRRGYKIRNDGEGPYVVFVG